MSEVVRDACRPDRELNSRDVRCAALYARRAVPQDQYRRRPCSRHNQAARQEGLKISLLPWTFRSIVDRIYKIVQDLHVDLVKSCKFHLTTQVRISHLN